MSGWYICELMNRIVNIGNSMVSSAMDNLHVRQIFYLGKKK
jgi:hypothetical protein